MMSSEVPALALSAPQPWQACPDPVRLLGPIKRGKKYRHEVLVAVTASGAGALPPDWIRFAGRELESTLRHLLGPAEPLGASLEMALREAALSWPPAGAADEPASIGLQRIAVAVAERHCSTARASPDAGAPERAGGVRELLTRVYAALSALPPLERLAFALVELGGRSLGEAAAVFNVPSNVLEQRVCRARRTLLFAARRDALLLRYLSLAARWRALAQMVRFCRASPPEAPRH
jgi:DNA-directed RNA polymerase specialized sigma24 family protein